jgi:hypothetical protein
MILSFVDLGERLIDHRRGGPTGMLAALGE